MNYNLPFIPKRDLKPRNKGLTMVIDKGISLNQIENLIESSAEYIDCVKLGFGTSIITPKLKEKIKLYKEAGINVYLGGTLFEIFAVREMIDEYKKFIDSLGLDRVEISDGVIELAHPEKCEIIRDFAKDFTVFSEVGSKVERYKLSSNEWVQQISDELNAGSWKVIAEARESGTIGIYDKSGAPNFDLIQKISKNINVDRIMWETPQKTQQVELIKLFGVDVNLGNIASHEVVELETLRLGLRGDTVLDFLPDQGFGL